MFGSNAIDIAIGLVSLFLLLSLIASAANEIIEGFIKKRAKDLARGIEELAGGDEAKYFLNELYNHGLINSLFRGKYGEPGVKLPSYIPARNFALAVIDITKNIRAKEANAAKDLRESASAKDASAPGAHEQATAAETTDATKAKMTDADTKAEVAILPHNIRTALDTLEAAAGTQVGDYEKSVEDWYNSAMDRVSGWYKRRSQVIIFFLGLLIAIAANADCIDYAKRLSTDASLRQSVVAFAEATAKADPTKDNKTPVQKITDEAKSLNGIGLPIGWDGKYPKSVSSIEDVLSHHSLGWLITALAVSLGAPFWFDTLNKIMVIRSTVKPHEKSKEEKPKDPTQNKTGSRTAAVTP